MNEEKTNQHYPLIYEIVIKEQLDQTWQEWFEQMTISTKIDDQGNTVTLLTGPIRDQAALHGILDKIWNLNLTVLSVESINQNEKGK